MTKRLIHPGAALLLSFVAAAATAQGVTANNAWVRATVPGQRATGAFMDLTSREGDVFLVGATSPVAAVAEIHEMVIDGSTMKMRALSKLELPAARKVELRPGGYHVMLMDLRRTLRVGETVPITLALEGPGGTRLGVEVRAEVRELATTGAPGKH